MKNKARIQEFIMSKTLYVRNLAIGQGSPKIVVPIVGRTKDSILSSAGKIRAMKPDMEDVTLPT